MTVIPVIKSTNDVKSIMSEYSKQNIVKDIYYTVNDYQYIELK